MKVISFLITAALIISLAGCKPPGSDKAADAKPSFDWTIDVNDTIDGYCELPEVGKTFECDITLRLVAWKSGGESVYGKYEGEAYILFDLDVSGMSGEELLFTGVDTFNRRCEKLEFEVGAYDYNKLETRTLTERTAVAPLRKFNAMASSISVWTTTLKTAHTIKETKTGRTIIEDNKAYDESSSDNMGIILLIDKEHVMVEIPTYRMAWNCGWFEGTVKRSKLGTAKRVKLEMPETGGGGGDGSAPAGQQGGNAGDFLRKELDSQYEYIENGPNGKSGYVMNGDGIADAYIDENGKLKIYEEFGDSIDKNIDLSDVEWGQG